MEPRNTGKKKGGGESMNHEWTRMDTNRTTKYRGGTTKNTKGTKKKAGGEYEPRMDTNGTTKYRSGTTKNTKGTKIEGGREYESRMDTNGHECQRQGQPRKTRNTRKRKKPVVGAVYEPRMHTNNRSRGKFPISAVPSFLLIPYNGKSRRLLGVTPWLDGF